MLFYEILKAALMSLPCTATAWIAVETKDREILDYNYTLLALLGLM
jgi:hypothetical protein